MKKSIFLFALVVGLSLFSSCSNMTGSNSTDNTTRQGEATGGVGATAPGGSTNSPGGQR